VRQIALAQYNHAWALLLGSCASTPAPTHVDGANSATAPATADGNVVAHHGYSGCFNGEAYERELRTVGDTYASESLVGHVR
jgi:hypothetical protein